MQDKVDRDVLIDAPIETVWPLISEPRHVGSWFSDEATFDSRPGAMVEKPLMKKGGR